MTKPRPVLSGIPRLMCRCGLFCRKVLRAIFADYCPLPLPGFIFMRGEDDMSKLHRACQRLLMAQCTTPQSWGRVLISTISWPFTAVLRSLVLVARNGRYVSMLHSVPCGRQFMRCMSAAMRHNMHVRYFYELDLFREGAPDPGSFFLPHELKVIAEVLTTSSKVPDISTKLEFFRRCVEHGLPHVPIFAVFTPDGCVQWFTDGAESLNGRDLFLKPADWSEASCGELWHWQQWKGNWRRHGQEADVQQLEVRGRASAAGRTMLLQPFVPDHSTLRPLGGLGTCTVRFTTINVLRGEPRPLCARLRIPGGGWLAECGSSASIEAQVIDLATGKLGDAVRPRSARRWKRHPDTGERIAGVHLPLWDKVVALALEAHRTMRGYPIMAWDIVIGGSELLLLNASADLTVDLSDALGGGLVSGNALAASVLKHCEQLGILAATA